MHRDHCSMLLARKQVHHGFIIMRLKFFNNKRHLCINPLECVKLGNQSIILIHGDSLCTDDFDYQNFRKMVRGAKWQAEFLARPLLERQQIALQLRRDSADAMAQKPMDIMDVADDAVAACFREYQADGIIHGHTHRPAIHQYQSGLTRYVLGDWNPGPSFLSWTPAEGFKLVDARVKND